MTTRNSVALLVILAWAPLIHVNVALDNGLGRVPWMGWSAWEVFRDTTVQQDPNHALSDSLIRQTADALVEGGNDSLAAAGYKIVWIDDAWASKERDSKTGALVPDPTRWPNGMKAVADYVHGKGLLLGLYGDIGTQTCAGYPGLNWSNGVDWSADAKQLADWGVDAFKVDGCNADPKTMHLSYPALGHALNQTGRPILYSCSWPDYERASNVSIDFGHLKASCNSWRIFWDVQAGEFDCISGYLEFAASGSTEQAAQFSANCPGDWNRRPIAVDAFAMNGVAGPGGFNDADMLPIGANYTMAGGKVVPVKVFTPVQARSAMALWTVLASPLMIGADVRNMDADSRSVFLNKGLIAANQDPLGLQGIRVRGNATLCQVWRRQLSGGEILCVIYNNGGCAKGVPDVLKTANITVTWDELGLSAAASVDVTELIADKHLGIVSTSLTVELVEGASAALRLKPQKSVLLV